MTAMPQAVFRLIDRRTLISILLLATFRSLSRRHERLDTSFLKSDPLYYPQQVQQRKWHSTTSGTAPELPVQALVGAAVLWRVALENNLFEAQASLPNVS